jgi:hypothetical protein
MRGLEDQHYQFSKNNELVSSLYAMLLILKIKVSRVITHEHYNYNVSFDAIVITCYFHGIEKQPDTSLTLPLRDFRHEKTKKKRGTYRGGQIDLHSHSVKFNYSDDE